MTWLRRSREVKGNNFGIREGAKSREVKGNNFGIIWKDLGNMLWSMISIIIVEGIKRLFFVRNNLGRFLISMLTSSYNIFDRFIGHLFCLPNRY